MRALKVIGIILLILIGLFFLIPAFLPSKIHVEVSQTINAPSKLVFEQVNSFQNWEPWNPFNDSGMVTTYEGDEAGVGAIMRWVKGSEKGSMEILESNPYSSIQVALNLMEGGNARADWAFEESSEGVDVKWSLDVMDLGYPVGRYMGLAFPSWVKPKYAKGLDSLKSQCERMAILPSFNMGEIQLVDVPERSVLMMSDSVALEDMEGFFSQSYGAIMNLMGQVGVEMAGAPFAIYHSWEMGKKSWISACIPVMSPVASTATIQFVSLPPTKAVTVSHFGPYDTVGPTWEALEQYIKDNDLEITGSPWESYANDPKDVKPSEIQTDIYYPIK